MEQIARIALLDAHVAMILRWRSMGNSERYSHPYTERVTRLSLTAMTPGIEPAAILIAVLSVLESTIPQRSTIPPTTVTL